MLRGFFILVYLLISNPSFTQNIDNQTDSLIWRIKNESSDSIKAELYDKIFNLNYYNHPNEAIEFAQKELIASQKINDPKLIEASYLNLSVGHYFKGSPADTILFYIQQLEEHVESQEDKSGRMQVFWMYAMYYGNLKQHDKEIEFFVKALEVLRQSEHTPDAETGL
ncbi:MAG: hypothetical protein AAF573_10675, partial [Bacteroidota bacterium]